MGRRGRGGKGGKAGEGRGKGGRGEEGKGREGRARRGPPIFYCIPSSSFLEICLLGVLRYNETYYVQGRLH